MIFQWQAQQSLPFVFSTHIRRFSFNSFARSVLLHVFLRLASWLAPSCRPVFFVQSFGPLRPVAHLSSFSFFARSVLSSCFLRSVFWLVPSCCTSFFFRLLGSLRPVFGFLVFLLTVCRAVPRSRLNRCLFGVRGRAPMAWTGRGDVVFADRWAAVGAVVGSFLPRGNGLGEMTQCGASSIAARCVWLCSAVRLSHVPSAIIVVPASMRKSTAQACSPITASASIPPLFSHPSSFPRLVCQLSSPRLSAFSVHSLRPPPSLLPFHSFLPPRSLFPSSQQPLSE